jgi:hypothetical protein
MLDEKKNECITVFERWVSIAIKKSEKPYKKKIKTEEEFLKYGSFNYNRKLECKGNAKGLP